MASTYSDITAKIARLQAEADRARKAEVADIIARAKKAIEAYGITAQDLFGSESKRAARKAGSTARYSDGQGNTWGGRGPRPHWLREALAAGATLESFASGSARATVAPSARKRTTARRAAGKQASASTRHSERTGKEVAVKFRDDQGNTWSGRGNHPRWLRDAIAAGRAKDDFKV